MIADILKDVKSPFSDELIKDLIEKYINKGCDNSLFYNEVNNVGQNEQNTSNHLRGVLKNIYAQGISKMDVWQKEEHEITFCYDDKRSWMILSSGEDPMKTDRIRRGQKMPLVYRIYLNLKGEQKAEFVENYLKKVMEDKIPFEFKFSKDESRLDQIILLSREENLEENIQIVKELTENKELGDVPTLIGKYHDRIGIVEDYYNRLYSPTQVRLALIRSSVKKYLCDHFTEFENELSESEKKEMKEYIEIFHYRYESEKEEIEVDGKEYRDFHRSYYQEKSTLECSKEHIENDSDSYVCGEGLKNLGNAINQIYRSNPEKFISEIIQNYRMIGTKVWGFSDDFVFSNETQNKYLKANEKEDGLSAKQIGSELEQISRTGLTDKVQADLISMVEEKDETKDIDCNLK